ncbi:ABC transporter ATP-binding protein [Cohnella silvisoli]|uniref:ABC transporter ATP-binding protein n=1 Tax=Cohnella silvisoli TaxID=2873699 RepID=A0ABV1L301_9BACL|nr:ABC transporter ATP-binding protein [Cohnella silvisoli]MCD9026044.1 ABC transporter ATP-binding protein [Cohnella silvisoli]
MIDYSKHRAAIEKLYEDKATISRYVTSEDPVSKKSRQQLAPVFTNQPCRLSQSDLASNGQTEAQNNIASESKLFIAPELSIQQGDEIEVTKGGVTRKYQAGEPFPPYPTHQEVSLQRKDKA